MQRRSFLRLLGGGVVVAAGASAGVFAATRTPTRALAPWGAAGRSSDASDPRLRALAYAILAPNPHNRQPWLIELVGMDTAVLRVDRERLLPHTDPYNRQITIGLGCFLELMVMAAAHDGFRVTVQPFPAGEDASALTDAPVAIATFVRDAGVAGDPLFAHVLARRSNKQPFDTARPVAPAHLGRLVAAGSGRTLLGGSVAPADVTSWRGLTSEALTIEIETPRTFKESVDLFRIGRAEIEAAPDGIAFSGVMFEALALAGQFNRESALDPTSTGFKQGKAAVLANTNTAMGHVWMVTRGNSRADQLAAGADWLRVNLAATADNLGFQPLSQALQEYREMNGLYRHVHAKLAPDGGVVQMLARIGHGPAIPPTPRWPLDARLKR